jgi:hypothetical protein
MLIGLIAAGLLGGAAVSPGEVPRARDGNIAIQEELCAARRKSTVEAYDLFIARHPSHPLVREARAERRRLLAKRAPGSGSKRCPGED